jgi:hypothetical protein
MYAPKTSSNLNGKQDSIKSMRPGNLQSPMHSTLAVWDLCDCEDLFADMLGFAPLLLREFEGVVMG